MSREDRKIKKLEKAYKEISKLTGLKLEDTVNHNYGLVIKNGHELYGQIGTYYCSEHFTNYFKFKNKRELFGFDSFDKNLSDEIFWTSDPLRILEELEKLKD